MKPLSVEMACLLGIQNDIQAMCLSSMHNKYFITYCRDLLNVIIKYFMYFFRGFFILTHSRPITRNFVKVSGFNLKCDKKD